MLFRLHHCAQKQHTDMDTDMELTQVPFNTVLCAFAYNGRFDIARAMYYVVRTHVTEAAGGGCTTKEVEDGEGNRERDGKELEELECVLAGERDVVPDAATYQTFLILACACCTSAIPRHGNLLETAIADMLSASAFISSPSRH
jgi:hypothetical protein